MKLLASLLRQFNASTPQASGMPTTLSPTLAEELQNLRTHRKEQFCRLSPTMVRETNGNEITDYHWPVQEHEVLWEVDFSRIPPMHKYFGRFKNGLFTGIKYNYGYLLNGKTATKYIESIFEYEDGSPEGLQIYFNPQGDVIRRIYGSEKTPFPHPEAVQSLVE